MLSMGVFAVTRETVDMAEAVTIEMAKAMWVAMPDPSVRKVAAAFVARGQPISHATIGKWLKSGWGTTPAAPRPPRLRVEEIIPAVPASDLGKATDAELLRIEAREALLTAISVHRTTRRALNSLIKKPKELGALLQAAGNATRSTHLAYDALMFQSERAMKLPPTHHPEQDATREGKQRR